MVKVSMLAALTALTALASARIPKNFRIITIGGSESGKYLTTYTDASGEDIVIAEFAANTGPKFQFNRTGQIDIPGGSAISYLDVCGDKCQGYEPFVVNQDSGAFPGYRINFAGFIQLGSSEQGPQPIGFQTLELCPNPDIPHQPTLPPVKQLFARFGRNTPVRQGCKSVDLFVV